MVHRIIVALVIGALFVGAGCSGPSEQKNGTPMKASAIERKQLPPPEPPPNIPLPTPVQPESVE